MGTERGNANLAAILTANAASQNHFAAADETTTFAQAVIARESSESTSFLSEKSQAIPARVAIPTTGGLIWIEGLRHRPRLRASYATIQDDFRPINISQDYHRFVTGPLLTVGLDGPFELSLSEEFDTGRSWEFPVLIAHLLMAQGQLRSGTKSSDKDASAGETNLIWATGMVDTELTPIAGDYMLSRKLELSRPLFDKMSGSGGQVTLMLSARLPNSEKNSARSFANELGLVFHEISGINDLQTVLGLEPKSTEIANLRQTTETRIQSKPEGKGNKHVGMKLVLSFAAVLLCAFIGFSIFGSGLSNRYKNSDLSQRAVSGINGIAIEGLYAKNRNDCIQRIWSGEPLEPRSLSGRGSKIVIPVDAGLCGIRLRNISEKIVSMTISNSLARYAIGGDNPLFQGSKIGANSKMELIFSKVPEPMTVDMTIATGVSASRTVSLTFLQNETATEPRVNQ
ncbi:MAG: hypothetical protein ACR2OX_04265 [Methyloligellaceae bacterium]